MTYRNIAGQWVVTAVSFAVVALAGCGAQETRPTAVSTGHPSSLSPSEVDRLTGPSPGASFNDDEVERAWQQKWGVDDISVVAAAIKEAAAKRPATDGGRDYDEEKLTFTQWIVGTTEAEEARADIRAAFDDVAGNSNLQLKFKRAAKNSHGVDVIGRNLSVAYSTDPAWPSRLPLTGVGDPATGTFVIEAGERADDADVVAYFDRRWPGLVTLSDAEPAPLE